jgi:hypothetical protein
MWRPGGVYGAQHIGPRSNAELYEFLLGPRQGCVHGQHPDLEAETAGAAGLVVTDLRIELHPRIEDDGLFIAHSSRSAEAFETRISSVLRGSSGRSAGAIAAQPATWRRPVDRRTKPTAPARRAHLGPAHGSLERSGRSHLHSRTTARVRQPGHTGIFSVSCFYEKRTAAALRP